MMEPRMNADERGSANRELPLNRELREQNREDSRPRLWTERAEDGEPRTAGRRP